MSLFEAQGLSCRFGDKVAVQSLDLTVSEGELVGLIGPDGAGKTTTFRMLTGLQRPTGGTLHRPLGREGISYVPQTFSLAPDLTVEENLRFQAGLFSLGDAAPRIARLLESVGLAPFRDRLSGALSGGMKQKLALCCALLTEPRLLLLDEPTTGVDPVSRREFWELLHTVHDQGVAILFSTPYMDEAEYAHRMLLMDEGRVLMEGDLPTFRASLPGLVFRVVSARRREVQKAIESLAPLDLFTEGEVIRARFPVQDPEPLHARLATLPGVEQVRLSEASLEDVFLHALASVSGGGRHG
ncbi:ABC transporter ATP-binding protein [Geothrix sp. PMB-07]|uniref:ABC transporter ATP-binding protein n=1 Tax=Geothrix sp. PMB-07 TaxID=3068640 RepID=UPI0027404E96|nr:ABC transporter ATP-binding protein [Geothrix sp. PMB-07]WLT33263.1 ABC transporter ATP-binding protein [Geothrix sp. PMB-07]